MVLFRSQVELLSVDPGLELTHCHSVVINTKKGKNHLFNKCISSMEVMGKIGGFHSSSLYLYNLQLAATVQYCTRLSYPQSSKQYKYITNRYADISPSMMKWDWKLDDSGLEFMWWVLFQPTAISEQLGLNTTWQVLWNSLRKLFSNIFLTFAKFREMVEQLVNYSEIDESLFQFIGTKTF